MIRSAVEDWQELSTLYERADELDDDALAAWLVGLASRAHPLLPQLQRMLAARSAVRAGDFLGALPPLEPARGAVVDPALAEGVRIGPYRLLWHIGRGGMAEVWLAHRDDGAFERTVAVKLLFRHAASIERDAFAQRFARERDILASLHHPNIAALHDAGVTTSGQPWLALEFVDGESITSWCDRQRLTLRGRIGVFRQVLLAVQHAHANLVIHRDLKPSNILVTAEGDVRLLDFGIAKLQDAEGGALADTELTRQGGRPLTVQYASPEQLLGQPLTTACDVYSLGVVLYELLCGERPYDLKAQTAAQLEQAILETDPKPPSRRVSSPLLAGLRSLSPKVARKVLAGDLDGVTLKAMAKRPPDRYASVDALRADLDLWLEGRPVEATQPTALRRTVKFVGRHVVGVAISGAIAITVIGLATAAVVLGLRAQSESARAVASKNFLFDMFRSADPNQSRGAEITAREILVAGREKAARSFPGQPELQAEVLLEIASVQSRLANYSGAADTFDAAAVLYRRSGRQHDALLAELQHADVVGRSGDVATTLALLDRMAPDVRSFADDRELQTRFLEARAWALRDAGRLDEAKASMDRALQQARAQHGDHHTRSIDMLRGLAIIENDSLQFAPAIRHIEQAAQWAARTPGLPPNDVVGIDIETARLQYDAGRYANAATFAASAAERCDGLLGVDSENCYLLNGVLVEIALHAGELDRAARLLPRLLAFEKVSGSPQRQAQALILACRVLAATGSLGQRPDLRERLRLLATSGPERRLSDEVKRSALIALAEASLYENDPASARAWLAQAARKRDAARSVLLDARERVFEGVALQMDSRHADALAAFDAAERDLGQSVGGGHVLTVLYRLNQARSRAALGEAARAVGIVEAALPILRSAVGAQSALVGRAQTLRADILARSDGTAYAPRPSLFFI